MAYGLTAQSRNVGGGPTGFAICNRAGIAGSMPPDSPAWPGVTAFRPLAVGNEDGTGIKPWFDKDNRVGFNGWIHMGRVVRRAGNHPDKSVTYFNEVPDSQSSQFDVEAGLPYDRLYAFVKAKADAKVPGFGKLMKGWDGRGAAVSAVKVGYVIQSALYRKDRRDAKPLTWGMPMYAAILMTTTARSVVDKLAFPNKQDPDEISQIFGDLFNPETRSMLVLHSNQKDLSFPMGEKWEVRASSHTPEEDQGDNSIGTFYVGHIVEAPDKFVIPTEREAGRRFVPWDELIRVPTVEEQTRLLCSSFTPDLLCAALGDTEFRDFLTDPVKAYLVGSRPSATGRTQTVQPSAPQSQSQAVQYPRGEAEEASPPVDGMAQ